ncbi:MAG: Rieske 2Fe-2S domain-containing protein [Gammaproteobacteria bacterium]|nr:Rieske 2Fe-2S domain-containing protein [Gammaproteobacteria bacterium]
MTARTGNDWRQPPPLPEGHWVSGQVYTDSGVYEDERREVFGRTWRLACHESELPEPFDYRTFEHAGQQLFAIRGPDNTVRCFLNACSHRGAQLLNEPAGNARQITCFYHLWAYDAFGSCLKIPRPVGYEGAELDKDNLGLRALRTETHLGLVFVNLDDDAPPLAGFLSGALAPFEEILGTVPLEVFHYSRTVLECNWKAWQETNMDIYHEYMHVVLRRTQVNAMPMSERRLKLYGNGHGGSAGLKAAYDGYSGFAGRGGEVAPLPGTTPTDFRFSVLFPASVVVSRGTCVRIDNVTPLSEHRTLLEMRGLGVRGEPAEDRRLRERHHNQYWGPFGRNVPEDMFAAEACGRSFGGATAAHQLIARDEGLTGQDDGILRAFYREWSARTGRSCGDPLGSVP